MFDQRDIDRVLDAARIEDVVGEFHTLTKDGSRYKCCCPFHQERTPSFVVTPARNSFHCFGCHTGGNAITFLMKDQQMTFPEAVRYLARKYGVAVEEKNEPKTAEELEDGRKRSAMLTANAMAAEWFAERLRDDDPRARFALDYATGRWGKKFVEQAGIGFAPGRGAFHAFAKGRGLADEILLETGLLRKDDKGRVYDYYYDRIVIPIRSRSNQVIGFTARILTDAKPKYINSPESLVFHKGEIVFGLNAAARQAAREELLYLVEGAPDVLRLHSLDINNAVASLGTAWSSAQFEQLRRFNPTLCFIPDIDPPKPGRKWGPGIEAVIKNGLKAVEEGFRVIVREIVPPDDSEKADPDSHIRSRALLEEIPKQDFIIWYAGKLLIGKETAGERTEVLKAVASPLSKVSDKEMLRILLRGLSKLLNVPASIIQGAVYGASKENAERGDGNRKMIDQELYQKYGFYERGHCYYSLGKDGDPVEWSNFTMEPLFHIKDQLNPKRLYRIRNNSGQEEIIEMKQADLVSLSQFKLRVEGFGNFIWKAKDEQLTKLKGFLYEKTETAVEITQLGWQRDQFFAFGNGVAYNGRWIPVDEFGIVRLGDTGNFYLPAASKIYRNERKLFQFERRFVHSALSDVSFRSYSDKLAEVFGDNAKVGICFLLATLFKDVVTSVTKNFPILNLFGQKGSGKSEFGHSLMSFFVINNEPPNLSSATDAALADTVAQCANALVHIDEYKNSIELSRREFLKGLYDGVGRTRMNMDRDKKRETTAVDCGVMLSGQEMPTVDIAIFSRLIYLTFDRSEFSPEAKRRFDELKEMRSLGGSHLVLEILKHRKRVEAEFGSNYKTALADVMGATEGESVEDRILRNWVIPLAIFRTLVGVIDVGFDYKELLRLCVAGIIRQNKECRSTNELAAFWQVVDFLHQDGAIYIDSDYRIKHETSFKGKGPGDKIIFPRAKPVLYLCVKRVFPLYKKNGKQNGDVTIPTESLRFYLENSKEYLGTKNAVRFKNYSNSAESTVPYTDNEGKPAVMRTSRTDWALCFDYAMLAENYGINLEVETAGDDDPDPADFDDNDTSKPY